MVQLEGIQQRRVGELVSLLHIVQMVEGAHLRVQHELPVGGRHHRPGSCSVPNESVDGEVGRRPRLAYRNAAPFRAG